MSFGATALVTGDFDTVDGLLDEVLQGADVEMELQHFDGFIHGPRFATPLPYDESSLELDVEDLLLGDGPEALANFDTAFFASGMRGAGELVYDGHDPDDHLIRDERAVGALRAATADGADLYVSDWAYDLVERAWPERILWVGDDERADDAQRGRPGTVQARVVDGELAELMGKAPGDELEIVFNLDGWAVIEDVEPEVRVLIEGDVEVLDPLTGLVDAREGVPLAVAFEPEGAGTVVFTSFHNEPQVSAEAQAVFLYELRNMGR